jgi:CAAX protease family protein
MQSKRFHQARALALAAALVGWNGLASPRVPPRWHPVPHAVLGAALVALTRAPLGLRRPALPAGLRLGSAAAAAVITAVAAATAVPAVRQAMAARPPTGPAARWLLLGIPVGTVWSEEAAFRGALGTLGDDAFGPLGGQVLQAVAFGLSHFGVAMQSISSETPAPPPARPLVLGTMLVTGVAGWAFDRLYRRTGSLAASMLAHLAINEAGAVAVLAVQRWAAARPR